MGQIKQNFSYQNHIYILTNVIYLISKNKKINTEKIKNA